MMTYEEALQTVFPTDNSAPLTSLATAVKHLMEQIDRDSSLELQIASNDDTEQMLCLIGITLNATPLDAMRMAFHTGVLVGMRMERDELPSGFDFQDPKRGGAHA